MLPQYRIVNDCLQLLNKSQIPPTVRLMFEVELIRVKILLLGEAKVDGAPSAGDDIFHHLLTLMKKAEHNHDVPALADLHDCIKSIQGLLTA